MNWMSSFCNRIYYSMGLKAFRRHYVTLNRVRSCLGNWFVYMTESLEQTSSSSTQTLLNVNQINFYLLNRMHACCAARNRPSVTDCKLRQPKNWTILLQRAITGQITESIKPEPCTPAKFNSWPNEHLPWNPVSPNWSGTLHALNNFRWWNSATCWGREIHSISLIWSIYCIQVVVQWTCFKIRMEE